MLQSHELSQSFLTLAGGKYQHRLEEIENNVMHDRQETELNDGSYAIAWQDVLAVLPPVPAERRMEPRILSLTKITWAGFEKSCGI